VLWVKSNVGRFLPFIEELLVLILFEKPHLVLVQFQVIETEINNFNQPTQVVAQHW